jgi:multidrug efflux system outer membrane protein
VDTPTAHRGAAGEAVAVSAQSFAETPWRQIFDDSVMHELVEQALKDNFDMRIAAERIEQMRAQFGISTSRLYPTIDAQGKFTAQRGSSAGSIIFVPRGTNLDVAYSDAGGLLNWELDLWGRLRRLREAARAQYLASEDARHGIQTAMIADVSFAYLQLRELDWELEIAEKTRRIAEDSLRLTQLRRTNGVATALDVRQAETLLYTATSQLAETRRAIEQQENAINLLLGGSPGSVKRGKALREIAGPVSIPADLPSSLLERRPDIRQAEQQLIAANAQIGADYLSDKRGWRAESGTVGLVYWPGTFVELLSGSYGPYFQCGAYPQQREIQRSGAKRGGAYLSENGANSVSRSIRFSGCLYPSAGTAQTAGTTGERTARKCTSFELPLPRWAR